MTGIEVLKAIRINDIFRYTPFLMLTAEIYKENVEEAIKAGVSDYIAKPFTTEVLTKKILKVLELT